MQRDARKIEALEIVGAGHLMRNVEANDVEGRDRRRALQRKQRDVRCAHLVGHVDPRDVAALAGQPGRLVEVAVEDGDALIGQADFIDVGVDEHAAMLRLGLIQGAPLVVDVAGRLLDARQQGLELRESVLVHSSHNLNYSYRNNSCSRNAPHEGRGATYLT
jgi:hypothetical protein